MSTSIARFTTLLHSTAANIKDLEDLARASASECSSLEKRHEALSIEVRNAERNLAALERDRVKLEAELVELTAKKRQLLQETKPK